MNDQPVPRSEPAETEQTPPGLPDARVARRRPFHFIWIIPIVAALIAAFLGIRALSERGPTITLTFKSGDGLTAGQTKVKHKAVDLGTVTAINLSKDMTHVEVRIDMRREAARVLTSAARFWVVRPRFDAATVSGLDTLISGSFIEMDPGHPSDKQQTDFTGLEDPPAVRSDEPGQTFTLNAPRIGSLGSGSPIFYRDIVAGEVLGYDLGQEGNGVTIHAFVREPYDKFVRANTHFWNVSGLAVDFSGGGLHVRVASLQALISGGIAFDVPPRAKPGDPIQANQRFGLFDDEAAADNAGYERRLKFVSYVQGSVRGLSPGAPVQLFGIQVGEVTDVDLQFDPKTGDSRVAIRMEIQPQRILSGDQLNTLSDPFEITQRLVDRGLRAQIQTANYITGQLVVAMVFEPNAGHAEVTREGDTIAVPGSVGGFDTVLNSVTDVATKLGRLPLDDIGRHLNDTLKGVSGIANGPELRQAIASLSATLASVQELVRKTDAGLTPTLRRLPEIAASLQAGVDRASRLLASVDSGYGGGSEFKRNTERLLVQVSDTARSVRLLADYLSQHPDALLRGRSDRSSER